MQTKKGKTPTSGIKLLDECKYNKLSELYTEKLKTASCEKLLGNTRNSMKRQVLNFNQACFLCKC